MRFGQNYYIYWLWLIPVLILFFIWAARKRKGLLKKFAENSLLNKLASLVNFKMQAVSQVILIFVFALSIFALMRPQWGFKWQEVKREGLDILIAIDTSKSMLATDTRPNRLQRSKLAVKDLVKKLKGDRVGLIAFAGSAYLQCPLTTDYSGFLLALNDISVETIPRAGTSISSAIEVAMKSFEGGADQFKVLIIITDGEDHEGNPVNMAEKAKKEGIKIFCIGIGTKGGELIQVTGPDGRKTFLKDREGNVVKSRLNEEVLQKVALLTGASYVRSSGAEFGLDYLYEEKLSKMEKKEIKEEMEKLYYERFQIPLAIALLLLIIEPFISDRKRIHI